LTLTNRIWGREFEDFGKSKMTLVRIKATAIVLDQGNTLLMDPFATVMQMQKNRFCDICQSQGIAENPELIISEWTKSNSRVNYPFIGHFYQEEPIVQDALRNLGVREDIAAILGLELLREYRIGLRKAIEADPRTQEVRNTLKGFKLRGKRLGVFSNDRAVALGFVLIVMGVRQYFEYIETSESIAVEKPDPRVFDHIVKFFGVPPNKVAYIGDDPIRDIEAAKAQGLTAIRYRVNKNTYQELWRDYGAKTQREPDVTIERLSELLEIIV
jgi:HAD superfamily hydrolase (TIGR01549 family)